MATKDPLSEPVPDDAPALGGRRSGDGDARDDAQAAMEDPATLEYIDVTAARAMRVGALLGLAFLAASFVWDAVVATDQLERLWMWRVGPGVAIIAGVSLSYALPQRAMWIGAVMTGISAASIAAVINILPYGFAYGTGALVLVAMAIGFTALDARAAGIACVAAAIGAGAALYAGGASEDAAIGIAFLLVPALLCAIGVAHVTSLRVQRNILIRNELLGLREDLARFGHTDELTGVHDERQLQQLARREIALARRRKSALSALKIDVEHLDTINNAHGRNAGDETLRAVASMCQATLRETDLLARLSAGDEFAAVLPEADASATDAICVRLRRSFEKASVFAGGNLIQVSVIVGAATLAEGDQSIEDLLKRADVSLRSRKDGSSAPAQAPAPANGASGNGTSA